MPLDVGGLGVETGWVGKWAFQRGALAADAIGRQAVEDRYITGQMLDNSVPSRLISVAAIDWSTLPTSDPGIYGLPWIDPTGHIAISAGGTTPDYPGPINPAYLDFSELPLVDPVTEGLAWIDSTGHVAVSAGPAAAPGSLYNPKYLYFGDLPTSDPAIAGRPWIDPTGHLTVSAG